MPPHVNSAQRKQRNQFLPFSLCPYLECSFKSIHVLDSIITNMLPVHACWRTGGPYLHVYWGKLPAMHKQGGDEKLEDQNLTGLSPFCMVQHSLHWIHFRLYSVDISKLKHFLWAIWGCIRCRVVYPEACLYISVPYANGFRCHKLGVSVCTMLIQHTYQT